MKPDHLLSAVYSDPVYRAIIRTVGYGWLPTTDIVGKITDVTMTHGRQAVDEAARELLDYETHDAVVYAKLKTRLHVFCRGQIGPMPCEWDTWWLNDNGTERPGKPKVWPPILPGPGKPAPVAEKFTEDEQPAEVPFEGSMSEVELLKATHGRKLRQMLLAQHALYQNYAPGDPIQEEAVRRMNLLEAEVRRRGNKVPPRPEWREPYDPEARETPQDIDLVAEAVAEAIRDETGLECEVQKPEQPRSIPLDRIERVRNLPNEELMRRLAGAGEIIASESEQSSVYKQTMIEVDLLEAEAERRNLWTDRPKSKSKDRFRPFAAHTTHRLKDLLDMAEYELTGCDPETVSYEEALRDIDLITAELRCRKEEDSESVAA